MAKAHGLVVADVTLKLFFVKQAVDIQDDGSRTWTAYMIIEGIVIDADGNEVIHMQDMTKKKAVLAQGSATPYSIQQIASNKDLIFSELASWASEIRESLAGITEG